MSAVTILDLPQGRVKFAGFPRCSDDYGRNAFEVLLPGRPALYGEWRLRFAENGNDFGVDIVSFGYLEKTRLGSIYGRASEPFSAQEIIATETLVQALFSSADAKKSVPPFKRDSDFYTDNLSFLEGWVHS